MLRFLIILLCLSGSLSAQRTISGIVVDAADGKPLSFVNVFLKSDQQYGVLTNERGEYRITLSEDQLSDRLVFSLLSYQTHEESLQQLDPDQAAFNLQMETSFLELAEIVVISDLGLRALVQRAIDAIPNNYGTGKYLLRAYSRQYDLDDGAYAQTVEAMLTIQDGIYHKPGPKKVSGPKAWISQYRISDYTGNARENMRLYNNAQYSLLSGYSGWVNKVRDHQVHWLASWGEKPMKMMTFFNRGEYLSGTDTLVRIQYNVRPKMAGIDSSTAREYDDFLSGEVLINKTDYAILRITNGKPSGDWYQDAVFQKSEGKYYVKKLTSFGQINYNNHTQTQSYNRLLYVTDVITDPKEIRKFKKGKLVVEGTISDISAPYDPNFWERNEILRLLPAPEALQLELSKAKSLDEQFRSNARRIKRDTVKK